MVSGPLPPLTLDNVHYNKLQGTEEKQIAAAEIALVKTRGNPSSYDGYYYFYPFRNLLAISFFNRLIL